MSDNNKIENGATSPDKKNRSNRHRRPGKRGRYPAKRSHTDNTEPQSAAEITIDEEIDVTEEIDDLPSDALPSDTSESFDQAQEEIPSECEPLKEEVSETEPVEMTEVIGVRFRSSGKIYYFDNCNVTYPLGCHAIVDTARGMEYGEVAMSNRMVPSSELVLPLREALRIATPEDDLHYAENKKKEAEAAEIWGKKIAQHGLEMKLIDVECTFDNSKLLFYFTAEGRVDFRDLVKDLASVFRCRIELRQMGIRDEAKILGGLGVCGRPFCCHSFLPDFVQVSIKMAKEQNLSLNSAKISGACGRLMCCLRYEYDTYLEEAKLTPKVDSLVRTPDGVGKVTETKPLLGLVKVQLSNSPDAAPVVYARDLLKPVKPGEVIETVPAPTAASTSAEAKEKELPKPEESKKQDPASKRVAQAPRKKLPETPERKKGGDHEPKKADKNPKNERAEAPQEKNEHVKQEKKYTIERAGNAEAGETPKKKDGGYRRRKNHSQKDRKEKKPGEMS